MNFFRFAFTVVVGLVVSTLTQAAQQPLRLTQIFVFHIVEHEGALAFDRGLLHAEGNFVPFDPAPSSAPAPVPSGLRDKYIIPAAIWFGYDVLGLEALRANFAFDLNVVEIGAQGYFVAAAKDNPVLDTGVLVNLSTRGVIASGGEPLIGGFVVEDRPRRLLLRAAGPTLQGMGIAQPLANPALAIFRQGENIPFVSNDDWDQGADADAIEQAMTTVGAFVFPRGSKDAALVIELPAGIYTAHLTGVGTAAGTALFEIYTLP